MDPPRLKTLFSRKRRASTSEKKERPDKKSTQGAHELFLEYEGFLNPTRPPRPSTSASTFAPSHSSRPSNRYDTKLSEETLRSSTVSRTRSHKSISSHGDAFLQSPSQPLKVNASRKQGLFSLRTLTHEQSAGQFDEKDEWPLKNNPEPEPNARPASSWLRRRISTTSRQTRPPPASLTPGAYPPTNITEQPYYRYSIYDDDTLTALPSFPGCETEQPKILEDRFAKGAAARAAAAAQNEMYESIRNMRLEEPKVTRDSESGVGIELWSQSASSRHVWREVFHAECQTQSQNAAINPTCWPGHGKARGHQDWKSMCRARKALQQRWRNGHAAAIYLEGHTDSVYCVQFDEDKILTGSRDRTIRIWDARTYQCIKIIGVPTRGAGSAVPPLPADVNVADRGQRPFMKVFSPPSSTVPTPVTPYLYHKGSILCLQYDTNLLVTGSSDCTLIMWDIKSSYTPIRRLHKHTAGVLDVCFDSKHIVSCSKDATVCLWDRESGNLLRRLTGHRGPVNAVQLRGNLVVSASGDGIAKLWNLTSGLCIKEFPSRDRGMACVEFSPDSRTILAGGNDQVIYQFDTGTGELVREMRGHEGLVRSLHLDSASGRIVSGSYDTSVRAYDLRTGECIVNFTKWTSSWILSAKSDYRRIVATSQDSRAVVMDFGYGLDGIESLET
ncbi:F-box and WD-40 domain protein 1/11, partial [Lecanoromycetidae sp. Uapishka_2]